MLETITIDTFAAHLGEIFRLRVPAEQALDLELAEVTRLSERTAAKAADGTPKREPFSLVFRGPADVIAPQRIYPIEHDAIGSLDMFLVPLGPDPTGKAGILYEAVFT